MIGHFAHAIIWHIGDPCASRGRSRNGDIVKSDANPLDDLQIGRRGDFSSASALSIILMLVVTVAYLFCARWLKIERT